MTLHVGGSSICYHSAARKWPRPDEWVEKHAVVFVWTLEKTENVNLQGTHVCVFFYLAPRWQRRQRRWWRTLRKIWTAKARRARQTGTCLTSNPNTSWPGRGSPAPPTADKNSLLWTVDSWTFWKRRLLCGDVSPAVNPKRKVPAHSCQEAFRPGWCGDTWGKCDKQQKMTLLTDNTCISCDYVIIKVNVCATSKRVLMWSCSSSDWSQQQWATDWHTIVTLNHIMFQPRCCFNCWNFAHLTFLQHRASFWWWCWPPVDRISSVLWIKWKLWGV